MPRVTYQNWIVELGRDPAWRSGDSTEQAIEINRMVGEAIRQLPDEEREFIVRFYYLGESYRRLSEATGRSVYRFEGIHRRAVRRLRNLLGPFVQDRFGLTIRRWESCPLCQSDSVEAIDRLLVAKTEPTTWRPIIRRLRDEFGITITTPQILITHARYHAMPFD